MKGVIFYKSSFHNEFSKILDVDGKSYSLRSKL
jgi:hypothetical protein